MEILFKGFIGASWLENASVSSLASCIGAYAKFLSVLIPLRIVFQKNIAQHCTSGIKVMSVFSAVTVFFGG